MANLLSRQVFVLIGNNNTGKTSFQRHLLAYLCDQPYQKLPTGRTWDVVHQDAPRRFEKIFLANRSFQEKRSEWGPIDDYVNGALDQDADVTILSSHADKGSLQDIQRMFELPIARGYNVSVIFFSNAFGTAEQDISASHHWNERLVINNPPVKTQETQQEKIQNQLWRRAIEFSNLLMRRAIAW